MNANAIKGMTVVSIADGDRLGVVDEVLIDTGSRRIGALRITADGHQALIPFDQLRSIGSDAVMVATNQVAQWVGAPNELGALATLGDLGKSKVVDEAGTFLGVVHDVEVDPQDGRITQLQVHKGGILGMGGETATVTAEDIITIGADLLTVRDRGRTAAGGQPSPSLP